MQITLGGPKEGSFLVGKVGKFWKVDDLNQDLTKRRLRVVQHSRLMQVGTN